MILLFITSIIVVAALALINLPIIMALIVGDKPLPGARTVTQEEMQGAARNE